MGTDDLDDAAWMADFLADLSESPSEKFPDWSDAEDLGRLHMQSFAKVSAGGFEDTQSRGSIRLTGNGVRGHSLNLDDAGHVLTNFQRLVTCAGASVRGFTSSHGRIAGEIEELTQLALTSSPGRGSVVLEFEPVAVESAERYPGGEISILGENTPLIEESLDVAFGVLSTAADIDQKLESIDKLFLGLGVRVASAALALADTISSASLNLDLSWQRPGFGRRKLMVSAAQCATFAAVLKGQGLDSDIEPIAGVLRTISDRRKIDLEIPDPENEGEYIVLPISRGDVDLTPFRLGQQVKINAQCRIVIKPGGGERRSYTALAIMAASEGEA
ncbi:hypothetical protein [Rhodococcus sp. 008]|uniref:hypothetical protein n=1 Tax=Rhodococcus sp. 008 TaxID=1723645 RepID=UPI0008062757|nr:hypothetical protein [Rhodococcus sp. 008]ANQ74429.1 hypothetical protein AOT96_29145 [Rhodococcus sp. 008]